MEVEVPEGAHVVDFEAPDLQPVEPVPGQQCPGGRPLGRRLAKHALRLEVTPDRRIRRQRRVGPGQGDPQIVEVQLHGPAGMLVILRRQDLDGGGGEALETTEVAAQAIPERGHRDRPPHGPRSTSARWSRRQSRRPVRTPDAARTWPTGRGALGITPRRRAERPARGR
jgi:hypothetical protein